MSVVKLSQFGKTLTGRDNAKECYLKLVEQDVAFPIEFDFDGVYCVSSSFVDEVIVSIARAQGGRVFAVNANPVVQSSLVDGCEDGKVRVFFKETTEPCGEQVKSKLLIENEFLKKELEEQARLVGMGSEREARLETEVRIAKERLGPAGYKILEEVLNLREENKSLRDELEQMANATKAKKPSGTPKIFKTFIRQSHENKTFEGSPEGDFIDDAMLDKEFPLTSSWRSIEAHLQSKGACDYALKAAENVFKAWKLMSARDKDLTDAEKAVFESWKSKK